MDSIKALLAVLLALLDKFCGDDSWLKVGMQDILANVEEYAGVLEKDRDFYRDKYFANSDELQAAKSRFEISENCCGELRQQLNELAPALTASPTFQIMLEYTGHKNFIRCINALRDGRKAMNISVAPEDQADTSLLTCKERILEVDGNDDKEGWPVLLYEGKDSETVKHVLQLLNTNRDGDSWIETYERPRYRVAVL